MGDYLVERVVVGSLSTNCYIVKDPKSRDACVIDPGADPTVIKDALHRMDASCRVILLTHGHFDHILALPELRNARTTVCIHKDDAHLLTERDMFSAVIPFDPRPFAPAELLFDKEGDYRVGPFEFYVIPTPGHTKGSVCILMDGYMFSGDTLFKGSIGTIDFGGDEAAMRRTLSMLYRLPGDYELLPGHEEPSTLSDERKYNPFFAPFRRGERA